MLIGRLSQQEDNIITNSPVNLTGRLAVPQVDQTVTPKYPNTEIGPISLDNVQHPIFTAPIIGKVAKGAFDVTKQSFDNTVSKFSDLFSSLGASNIAKDRPVDINQPTGLTANMTPGQRKEFYDKKQQEGSILNKVVKAGDAGFSLINFVPAIAQFNAELAAAKQLPGPLSAPAKAIDWAFGKASELGANIMSKSIDGYQSAGVISPQTANTIKPLTQDLASFATLIIGTKIGFNTIEKGLGETVNRLPISPETGNKINKVVQVGTGFSMQPFSTAYGLAQGLIASKIEQRRQNGTEITPEEGVKIIDEVKKELPSVIDETKNSIRAQEIPVQSTITPEITPKTLENINNSQSIITPAETQNKPILETNPSKIGKSIEAKAVEDNLTKGFENTARYEAISIKEQAKKATDLINSDIQTARDIIKGDKPLPDDLRGTALITAMEEHIKKNKDYELAYELANSELVSGTSYAAQELRLAAERTPDSATARVLELKKLREAQASKNTKTKTSEIKERIKKEIQKVNLPKEDLQWSKFLEEITC